MKRLLTIILILVLLVACNRTPIEPDEVESSVVSVVEPSSSMDPGEEAMNTTDETEEEHTYIYRLDLGLPPEERYWIEEDVWPITFADEQELMWYLYGEEDYTNQPPMCTVTIDNGLCYLDFIENVTLDAAFINNVCRSLFKTKGIPIYDNNSIFVTQSGEKVAGLPYHGDGSFQFTYMITGYSGNIPVVIDFPIYTPDEMRELWEALPFTPGVQPFYSYMPEEETARNPQHEDALNALFNPADPTLRELNAYLVCINPDDQDFTYVSPEGHEDYILLTTLREFIQSTSYYSYDPESIGEELYSILASNYKYNDTGGGAVHVEKLAQYLFGEYLIIYHKEPLGINYNYWPTLEFYSAVAISGAAQRGSTPLVLEYTYVGNRWEVELVLIDIDIKYDYCVDGVELTPDNALDLIYNHADRAKVTLIQREDGSFQLESWTL